jgi:hypothetical protein
MVIGGIAVNYYGYKRNTGDLDIWIEDTLENRKCLIDVFDTLGYGRFEQLQTIEFVPGFCEIVMDSGIYIDILTYIHGFSAEEFSACYTNSAIEHFNQIPVRFIGLDQLKESKRQSKRQKDINDFDELNNPTF